MFKVKKKKKNRKWNTPEEQRQTGLESTRKNCNDRSGALNAQTFYERAYVKKYSKPGALIVGVISQIVEQEAL